MDSLRGLLWIQLAWKNLSKYHGGNTVAKGTLRREPFILRRLNLSMIFAQSYSIMPLWRGAKYYQSPLPIPWAWPYIALRALGSAFARIGTVLN